MSRYSIVLNKKKIRENAEKIKKHFEDYNISISVINHKVDLIIANPNIIYRDIKICFYKTEIVFYFSYQHAHFSYNDLSGLIEYIDSFLKNKIAAVEFFEGDWDCCGGSREYSCIDLSSAEAIASLFGENKEDLLLAFKNNLWRFYVQCWDSSNDKAAALVWDGYYYSVVKIDQINTGNSSVIK